MDLVEQFLVIRDKLSDIIKQHLPVYFSCLFDPHCEYILVKETSKIILEELKADFPAYPESLLPQFKIRRSPDDPSDVELMTQYYFSDLKGLRYLGTINIQDEMYDVYIRNSYWIGDFALVAKNGHESTNIITGGEQAAYEHDMGMYTPLAIAYQLALDSGEI